WEWNYGESPDFGFKNYKRSPVGSIEVRLEIKNGIIEEAKIFGDFFGTKDVSLLETELKGLKYNRSEIQDKLESLNIKDFFGNIENEEFLSLLFQ
ncbi:MAG: lipoate--protein ligase, partial [Clostridia bacterium]|nr:lipoate--protein ligase [Clostridia bacterium]